MSAEVIEMAPHKLQLVGAGAERHQQDQSTAMVPAASMFAGLTLMEREIMVTGLIETAARSLREAVKAGEPAEVMSAYKDQTAAIADLTKRIDVSKDAVLDAQVLQRSAERSLGVAIRQGQEDGSIARKGQGGGPKSDYVRNGSHISVISSSNVEQDVPGPMDFASRAELHGHSGGTGIYALADNGTEEDFEAALTEAREDGNVSRMNVVRKLKERVERAEVESASSEAKRTDMLAWHQQLAETYPLPRLAFEAEGHERHSTAEAFASAARDTYKVSYRFNEKSYAKHVAQSQDWLDRSSMSIEVSLGVLSHIDFSTITPEQAEEALQRIDLSQLKQYIKTLEGITNE